MLLLLEQAYEGNLEQAIEDTLEGGGHLSRSSHSPARTVAPAADTSRKRSVTSAPSRKRSFDRIARNVKVRSDDYDDNDDNDDNDNDDDDDFDSHRRYSSVSSHTDTQPRKRTTSPRAAVATTSEAIAQEAEAADTEEFVRAPIPKRVERLLPETYTAPHVPDLATIGALEKFATVFLMFCA